MSMRLLFAFLTLAGATGARAARPASDIQSPEQRRALLEKADRLTRPAAPASAEPEIVTLFNPPGFDRPDPTEARERRNDSRTEAAQPPAPLSDHEVLAAVAAKIPTTGTIHLGGRPLLISGTNRIEVGSRFTVVYNGQEYELELVAIDRTTFTVRYKGEEFTRPIKLAKTP